MHILNKDNDLFVQKGHRMEEMMENKKRRKWMIFTISILAVCFAAQSSLWAESADTFLPAEYVAYCEEIGGQYGICPELLEAIMESESSGNHKAQNGNCKGLMQINVTYHKNRMSKLGVTDIYDARGNILTAADYLAELFLEYGDVGTALMVYNGSKGAVSRGKEGNYTEYASKIVRRSEQLERLHGK